MQLGCKMHAMITGCVCCQPVPRCRPARDWLKWLPSKAEPTNMAPSQSESMQQAASAADMSMCTARSCWEAISSRVSLRGLTGHTFSIRSTLLLAFSTAVYCCATELLACTVQGAQVCAIALSCALLLPSAPCTPQPSPLAT